MLPVTEADRHFFQEHSSLLVNVSIPSIEVLKNMIGNSGMRKQFFANPTRDWFIWRENKKDGRLRATSYRAFNGDINFPSPEAMEALLICNVDDLNDFMLGEYVDCTVDEEDEVKKTINDELNDDV